MRVHLLQEDVLNMLKPDEKYRFEFTTSSKTVKERLGVK